DARDERAPKRARRLHRAVRGPGRRGECGGHHADRHDERCFHETSSLETRWRVYPRAAHAGESRCPAGVSAECARRESFDTGPFVAYVDSADPRHADVAARLDDFIGQLVTTGAVVTETMYFLSDVEAARRRSPSCWLRPIPVSPTSTIPAMSRRRPA